MSSVFGQAIIISVEKTEDNDIYKYKCYDKECKSIITIKHKENLPIKTKIYWEDFLKDKKFFWCLLDNPEINSVIKY